MIQMNLRRVRIERPHWVTDCDGHEMRFVRREMRWWPIWSRNGNQPIGPELAIAALDRWMTFSSAFPYWIPTLNINDMH